ncbi:Kynureninase (L-kynurenine hydrolase) [Exophiala dermatitidis]|uniref:Kynureninase n=2 Tax=Exophiala dermatitidis TaxID=5970 RepID=H6BMK0_EXODN|nr:kynureninase 1 [Exophiala dermatitidis NIH/UT8656]KAJ4512168.1 Kynureninase (L-kynurenine hydrolase) [Exophiala dermatitidis]EHY53027.1 kynureninase 1 [Exophiala dermatitidis NIH/UT8656]KAJ4515066.1 Kynureninase (L-kynurenine hydrolase) [Exophiala dermatitidis]KAJ4517557.1 Kynureninase (L-kynurenine hydrolase) [Exophiala dermatitidis]KAJ4548682.1 Kynureninase (L-kynurenine hydrolase) [Exophiala dermatitidis]
MGDQDRFTKDYAASLDATDPLSHFRSEFYIPTLADLKRSTLAQPPDEEPSTPSTYLCGNSLGLQPKRTANLINAFLTQWRTKGVTGHFVEHTDSPLPPFLHIDDYAAKLMAPVVGARQEEVAVMGSLTGNLHLLMSSFYRPSAKGQGRWKILLEGKAFPSDHYAVESQIVHHGLDPAEAMVLLEPTDPRFPLLPTTQILRTIDEHASELALILLPGVQFYTGQYFDIQTITAHAHSHGILIGWDCAHAVGNVDLRLHDWDVDFAAWCSYKYLNAGPGAMAGIFVNERFGKVDMANSNPTQKFWPRLTGWWGDDKSSRFQMTNKFVPRPGAAGYQLSNPSALDQAAVVASLQIFNETSMAQLRDKSRRLTTYLEQILHTMTERRPGLFDIITSREPEERGAQLSIRLSPGLLDSVLEHLEQEGVVVDERKPDVIRVAPVPLYNSFTDVFRFSQVLEAALDKASSQTTAR